MDERSELRALLDGVEGHEYDEVFSQLAHGELSEREEEALRTSEDPEIRRLYELFRPLDDEDKHHFRHLVEQFFAKQAVVQPQLATERPLPVVPPAPRHLRRFVSAGLTLAAAAGLIVWFISSRHVPTGGLQEQPSALRFYPGNTPVERSESGSTLLGAEGTNAGKVELPAEACWKLQLGVAKPGKLPATTRAFFVRENSAVPWSVTFEPLANGRMGLRGGCARLPALSPGAWELVIQSGTSLPDLDPVTACRNGPPSGATWRCDPCPYPIRILPPLTETP